MQRLVWVAVLVLMSSIAAAGQGVIGILHDPSVPAKPGHADVQAFAGWLQREGFTVRLLSPEALADPQQLNPERVAVLVLPYGAFFPARAVEPFRAYLKAGGRFLSLGGYAFDELYGDARQRALPLEWQNAAPPPVRVQIKGQYVQIAVPRDLPVDWYRARAWVDLEPEKTYVLTANVRTGGITNGHGAYLAADFYDAEGRRFHFEQTPLFTWTDGWQPVRLWLTVPAGTRRAGINCIVHGYGAAEFKEMDLRPSRPSMNTRWAQTGDWLQLQPEQMGVFDPSFRLDGATALYRLQNGQESKTPLWRSKEPLRGYAAVGLIGSNNPVVPQPWARFVPVLTARDRFGRYLGPALSRLHHFDGPYKGSSWAFCGIENKDLTRSVAFREIIAEVLRQLLRGTYLHSLHPSFWCYRAGEEFTVSVQVRNNGTAPQGGTVRLEILSMPDRLRMGTPQVLGEQKIQLKPGEQTTVQMRGRVPSKAASLYAIRATLAAVQSVGRRLYLSRTSAGAVPPALQIDILWSGFCVWSEGVFKKATPISWRENTLQEWNVAKKQWQPRFWLGTNQTGILLATDWENPLQWEYEFTLMRRMGLSVLRVLHLSHFAGDFERPRPEFWRRYDALVLMAHRHGLVLMPCLHDWRGGVSVSDEELRKQCALVRQIAARYKHAPRIMWDLENEAPVLFHDLPDLHRLFNEWLQRKYGTTEHLQAAWGEPVKMGEARFATHEPKGWQDLKFRDLQQFRRWLIERWVAANVRALREGGARQPVTDEIDWKIAGDHYEGSRWLTFTNLHYYGDRSSIALASYLKFHERLLRGQGLAVGEFGARDHPSFIGTAGWAPTSEVIQYFVRFPLLTHALGGCMALNWDWKDLESCVFPWGLVYPHGISATLTKTNQKKGFEWRVEAALKSSGKAFVAGGVAIAEGGLAGKEPRAKEPPITVGMVLPDEHLLGAEGEVGWSGGGPQGRVSRAVFRSLEALLRLGVEFRVLREWEWEKGRVGDQKWVEGWKDGSVEGKRGDEKRQTPNVKPETRICLFPIPFVWRDETFAALQRYVQQGGIALITGDFTFDPDRQRTRPQRLTDLFGLEVLEGIETPLLLENVPEVRCLAADKNFSLNEWQGKPCVQLGQGKVEGLQVLACTEGGAPIILARKLGKGWVIYCADAPEFRDVLQTTALYKALFQSNAICQIALQTTKPPAITARKPVRWWLNLQSLPILLLRESPGSFIPLKSGTIHLPFHKSKAHITVRDLLTGQVMQRITLQAKQHMLTIIVPQDLILTRWDLE